MAHLNDPRFWEWLKEKGREQTKNQEFEPIPLYISIDQPQKKNEIEKEDSAEGEIDYSIEDNIVYQL